MQQIYTAIIPISFFILLGFIAQLITDKRHPILKKMEDAGIYTKENWSYRLNEFVLYIGLPALILQTFLDSKMRVLNASSAFHFTVLSALVFLSLLYTYAAIRYKHDQQRLKTLVLCGFFGNVAYIGYPYITAILPSSAPLISMVVGVHIAVVFTFILYLLDHHSQDRFSLKNIVVSLGKQPLLIAIVAGLLINHFQPSVHPLVLEIITKLGNTAGPVVLIALGAFFAHNHKYPQDSELLSTVLVAKLIAFPTFAFFLGMYFFAGEPILVSILESGMPVAITTFALADKYNLNKGVVAYAILASTILSLVTLPIITYIIT